MDRIALAQQLVVLANELANLSAFENTLEAAFTEVLRNNTIELSKKKVNSGVSFEKALKVAARVAVNNSVRVLINWEDGEPIRL